MVNRTPPKRSGIETLGVAEWLHRRGFSYDTFKTLVGNNPDDPLVSKERLAGEIGASKMTLYRLLDKYKRELQGQT